MNTTCKLSILVISGAVAACSATKRNVEMYRKDTQTVLETRTAQLETCYDGVLAADATAAGTVAVKFVVEKKTGAFTKVTIDPARSNAAEPLVNCVLEAVNGLALQPADASEGQATFVYEFKPQPPAT